ncbi:hypothetical protein N7E02_12155 [Aliirhizobium terrae]|uniref:hypothetical protein n=1 Tax=Terrirhizobium terrae TaxID=2926709 RepID=UPI00257741EB|nr:hypothetical protein [Rhizobium sp. CC-CFT758]WJH41201.1 hypothetical protein N7E02_12155 [Rhizobium sp. CC-CFT758]
MTAPSDPGSGPRSSAGWLGVLAACLGIAAGPSSGRADETAFHRANAAPQAWNAFAIRLQQDLQARLTQTVSKDAAAARMLSEAGGGPHGRILAELWVSPRGRIDRVVVTGTGQALGSALHGALFGQEITAIPPADMPQPIRLRLLPDEPARVR